MSGHLRLLRSPRWVKFRGFSLVVFSWHGGGFDLRLREGGLILTVVGYLPGRRLNAWLSPDGTPNRATWMWREDDGR